LLHSYNESYVIGYLRLLLVTFVAMYYFIT